MDMEQRRGGGLAGVRAAVRRAREYAAERGLPLTVERLAAELQMRPEELRAAAEGGPAGGVKDERALRVLRRAYGEAMASVVEHALSKGGGASMHQAYLKNYGALGSEGGESKAPVCFTGGDRLEE